MQVGSSSKDSLSGIADDISALKLGFNSLNDELRSLKAHLSTMEGTLSSLRAYVEALQNSLEIKFLSLKTYAKIISKVESRIAREEMHEH